MKSEATVFVGMSGGVDSSVAALRLKKQGYNVVGVFIKVWQPDFLECNWEQERLDAMRVAAHLNIPFLTCNAEAAYRDEVGMFFVNEYLAGRTPNPDVMCNQHVKFGAFLQFAMAHGADYIATGHYAQKQTQKDGTYALLRGVDTNKDQSYFLWTLTQEQLAKTLLPVGNSPKQTIREEADAARIPVAHKKDSQGVCFLGHIDIPEFLSHFTTLTPGSVLDTSGEIIGEHVGALVYTLGQRHGFTVHTHDTERTHMYVVDRDMETNTITVAAKPPVTTPTEHTVLSACNWIVQPPADMIEAQFRYRQSPFLVSLLESTSDTAVLQVADQTQKPSVGQSCVLYQGGVCLGGGIITG